jgi:hypothetical protein
MIGGGIAAAVLVVLLVHREVYSLVMGRKEYRIDKSAYSVSLAPRWTGGRNAVAVDLGPDSWDGNLFDDGAVARVGRALEANPWVRRVTAVERVFGEGLRVRFEYRKPYVTVRTAEGWIAVAEDRVRLPGVWAERPPRVLSADLVGAGTPPAPGRRWDDPGLEAGIELAELADREPALATVEAVDVANAGGRVDARKSELAFLTSGGCVIYWGRAESAKKFGELTPAEKVRNLKLVLRSYPQLDGLQYVKVYYREPAVLERDGRTTDRRR